MDEADFAADLAERERQALLERHRRRLPPPAASARAPVRLDLLLDRPDEERGR